MRVTLGRVKLVALLSALSALTVASRLPFLPPRLAHWDAVNYALGLHDFNVAAHQPHPPGSPYFILLGRAALSLVGDDNTALIPGGLTQPEMQLPFEPGRSWAFTSGPHPGFGSTLPWGAIDFAPPAEKPGCAVSPEWDVAVRAGQVAYSQDGIVELDVGGGWTVVYLHVETRDRAPVGTVVAAGGRLGHPSCEGGEATAAHLHISRRYNGEWIPADGFAPFVLSGWTVHAGAGPYKGTLTNGDMTIEACSCANAGTRLQLP